MQISVTTNAPEYSDALVRFVQTFRISAAEAIRYQGRLLGDRLVKLTPPRNQKQGKNAVKRDIYRLFLGLETMDEFDVAHYVLKGDTNIIRVFIKNGQPYGVDKAEYKPHATLKEMSDHHQKHRLKDGTVTTAGLATQDIGRWKFIHKMVVPQTILDEYIGVVQSRVGRAKGGWATGFLALGGKVSNWIGVHARTAGRFTDGTKDDSSDPYVIFVNQSEWASGGDKDRVMENAIKGRTRDINRSIRNAIRDASKPTFKFGA